MRVRRSGILMRSPGLHRVRRVRYTPADTALADIADWPGNELSGTVWEELIDDKDGTVTSATVKGHNGPRGDGFAWGFDGLDDRVRADGVATAFNAQRTEITILGRFKQTDASPTSDESIFYFRSANGENFIHLFNDTLDGEIHLVFKTSNTVRTELTLTGVGLGWTGFGVSISQANNEMYFRIGGVSSSKNVFTAFDADIDEFYFASDNTSSWFLGSLADNEIRPLRTDAEIDLIDDRTAGGTVNFFTEDASGEGHHLTNVGATRTTSPFASGGADLNQPLHTEALRLFEDPHADLYPVAGNTLYIGVWVQFDDDGTRHSFVSYGSLTSTTNVNHNYRIERRTDNNIRFTAFGGTSASFPTPISVSKDVLVFIGCYINFDTKTIGLSVDGSAYNTAVLTNDPNQNLVGAFELGIITSAASAMLNGTLGPVVLINQPKADADPLPGIYNSGTPLTTLALIEAEIDTPANLKLCNLWPVTTAT